MMVYCLFSINSVFSVVVHWYLFKGSIMVTIENNGQWPVANILQCNVKRLYSHKSRIQLSVDYSSVHKQFTYKRDWQPHSVTYGTALHFQESDSDLESLFRWRVLHEWSHSQQVAWQVIWHACVRWRLFCSCRALMLRSSILRLFFFYNSYFKAL